MSDQIMPRNLRQARTSLRYIDSTGVSRSTFTGALVTAGKGGDRLSLTLEFTKHGGRTATGASERALLRRFLASLRGRQNRAYIQDLSYKRRGSFPSGELLANNTFSNGTTGWTSASEYSLSVADRIARVTRTTGVGAAIALQQSASGLVQYAPYAFRLMNLAGRGTFPDNGPAYGGDSSTITSGFGLKTHAAVVLVTNPTWAIGESVPGGLIAGDYYSIQYASLSRCALVDNSPNLLLQSDTLATSPWTSAGLSSVSANAATAPDGTVTADTLNENGSNVQHYITQPLTVSSAVADYSFSVAVLASNRTWCRLQINENTGSTAASAYFNLSTGAVGTSAAGANWSNIRTSVTPLGSSWYKCTVTARKTNAATSLDAYIAAASADNTAIYTGGSFTALHAWRATIAQSSVPTKLRQTTGSALLSGSLQPGSALSLKGLPASTDGLLEIDDQVEIITSRGSELKLVTARLNSDAAGLGYLQFEPPIRTSPADNAAVIINQPMGRFLFTGDQVGFDNDPGQWSSATAEFEEAI